MIPRGSPASELVLCIADRENREELKAIKSALDRLEGGSTFDIFAESADEN